MTRQLHLRDSAFKLACPYSSPEYRVTQKVLPQTGVDKCRAFNHMQVFGLVLMCTVWSINHLAGTANAPSSGFRRHVRSTKLTPLTFRCGVHIEA
jgi:hypothetical protein